ncbi:hypothetical protein BACI349Y_450118 [Bacillus sp. 349Y]|nr:hypothetical protein BACI349Y_450118 [Bacillus sp. 349Y]
MNLEHIFINPYHLQQFYFFHVRKLSGKILLILKEDIQWLLVVEIKLRKKLKRKKQKFGLVPLKIVKAG